MNVRTAIIIIILCLMLKVVVDIRGLLLDIKEENSFRVTEINHNFFDVKSYGEVVLPDELTKKRGFQK